MASRAVPLQKLVFLSTWFLKGLGPLDLGMTLGTTLSGLAPKGRRGPHCTEESSQWAGEGLGLGSTLASLPWDREPATQMRNSELQPSCRFVS